MAEGDEIPKIKLGKREFPIPELPWRVTKKLMPKMSQCASINPGNITDEKMEAIGEAIWLVVSFGTPDLKRDEFENLTMSLQQMIEAIPIIIRQADLKTVETKPGEAPVQPSPGLNS